MAGKWEQKESEAPKVAYTGYAELVKQPSSSYVQGQGSNSYQNTMKNSIVDKQTGDYMRETYKESASTGDVFKERSTGRYGYKDEYKTTSTTRVGDKSGYSEYQCEERFRRVSYEDCSRRRGGNNRYSNRNYLE